MIKRKQASIKSYKEKTAKRTGVYGIVAQFIDDMEKVSTESENPVDFGTGLQRESRLLLDRMKHTDPDVDIEIRWNRENSAETWKDLRVEGVLIKWSRFYLSKHNLHHPEKYIDVSQLFLEGYLDCD